MNGLSIGGGKGRYLSRRLTFSGYFGAVNFYDTTFPDFLIKVVFSSDYMFDLVEILMGYCHQVRRMYLQDNRHMTALSFFPAHVQNITGVYPFHPCIHSSARTPVMYPCTVFHGCTDKFCTDASSNLFAHVVVGEIQHFLIEWWGRNIRRANKFRSSLRLELRELYQ